MTGAEVTGEAERDLAAVIDERVIPVARALAACAGETDGAHVRSLARELGIAAEAVMTLADAHGDVLSPDERT
jgi:hypothetical protein